MHPELPGNLAGVVPAPDLPGLDGLLATAPHVFTETFDQHRYADVPMETRGLVAEWDRWTGQLEVVIAGQGVHVPRLFFSRMLGLPEDDVRVIMGDVGGSFGQKAFPQREDQAVVVAAVILGERPVKWIEDRAENLISGGHAREESLQITAATDENGVLLAARAHHIENVGAYPAGSNGQTAGGQRACSPGRTTGPGPGSVAYSGQAVYTNTGGHCAYRGPWMMETTGREQMVDVIAQQLGIDPLEIRRRNVISRDELPYTSASSMPYDAISPAETLEQAAELIGYEQFRKDQERARAEGRLVGIGLSLYIEPQRGDLGTYAATIRVEPSGKVNVYMGTGSHGQSIETTMTQIVADEMGVNIEDVHFTQGDTDSTPQGAEHRRQQDGRGGGRRGAPGRRGHARAGPGRGRADAGDRPGRPGDDRQRGPGQGRPGEQERDAGRDRRRRLPDQPRRAAARRRTGPGNLQALPGAAIHVLQRLPRGDGGGRPGDRQVHILRYVISEDCGVMINPNVVEGQTAGGVVQGIGGVFYEHIRYDEAGNPTTTTFMDYLLPTAAEVPDLEYGHVVTPGLTPGGHKGLGEGGAIGSPAALVNAVRDALAPLGVSITSQPLTPDRVLDLIEPVP